MIRYLYTRLPGSGIKNPIFIIGCGRSGTTLLGKTLAKHKDIRYLHEPRKIWSNIFPETDIWSPKCFNSKGKLVLDALDADHKRSVKLRKLFQYELKKSRRKILVEKLPINNFRLHFIKQIFPYAKFIHIYRNGVEVAKSIENMCQKGNWYGHKNYKWNKLVEYARQFESIKNLPDQCSTYYEKGLFEWRLSTEAAVTFLRNNNDDSYIELSYDYLVKCPGLAISKVIDYIKLEHDMNVFNYVTLNIKRRSNILYYKDLSSKEIMLGGSLLRMSIFEEHGLSHKIINTKDY